MTAFAAILTDVGDSEHPGAGDLPEFPQWPWRFGCGALETVIAFVTQKNLYAEARTLHKYLC